MNFRFLRHLGMSLCITLLLTFSYSIAAGQITVHAVSYTSATISPTPTVLCGNGTSPCRYDAWTGAWVMPDGSVMAAYTRATGPSSPAQGRTFMPEASLHTFGLTENGTAGYSSFEKGRDFFGLSGGCPASPTLATATQKCTEIVYIRSTDSGITWTPWRTDAFQALNPSAYTPQATTALPGGTLIRRVNGDDLQNLSVPHTAMLQTIAPNGSGVYPAWPALGGTGQVVLNDPSICKYQISRIKPLNDLTGRVIAMGQSWPYASGTSGPCGSITQATDLLLVAASEAEVALGHWKKAMPNISSSVLVANEWDAAPLPNGNLLALFRTQTSTTNTTPIRKQAILRVSTDPGCADSSIGCWVLDPLTLGNPGGLQHSGHPELLATQEGVIIEFASDRVAYTGDGGTSWITLSGFTTPTNYYPRATQDGNGKIYVVSHVGCDDPYSGYESKNYTGTPTGTGCWQSSGVLQSITLQKFQLFIDSTGTSAPSATTGTASPVGTTTATLNGTVNPHGLATTYKFQYGTTTSYGSNTANVAAGSGTTNVAASANLTGLTTGATYHFRVVATNSLGTTNGLDRTFTTGASSSYSQTVLNDNPVSYWRLGEASGTVAADQKAVNPGTYTAVTLGVAGAVTGNTAASFNGSTSNMLAADSASLDTGDTFTVEAWIKPSLLGVSNTIVNKFGSYFLYLDGTNHLVLYKPNTGPVATSTTTISSTTSYHYVAVTKAGTAVHLYIDGVDVTANPVTSLTIANSTGGLYIGYLGGSPFHGAIDEVAVYSTALTAAKITSHFSAAP